jgi:hypothetical protein
MNPREKFLKYELGLARLGSYLNHGYVRNFLNQRARKIEKSLKLVEKTLDK